MIEKEGNSTAQGNSPSVSAIPPEVYHRVAPAGLGYSSLNLLVIVAMVLSFYLVFMWVPGERVMGAVQRIFYFHVSAAVACYCSFAIVFGASVAVLATRSEKADVWAEASAEVGFLFCTLVLITGMIWGHAAWGVWFNWEPRLITFLLLWLLFFSYVILRRFGEPERVARHAAVLGILGSITVPLMVFSIRLLPQIAQLHPLVVEKRGLAPEMEQVLLATMVTLVLFQALLLWLRVRVGLCELALKK